MSRPWDRCAPDQRDYFDRYGDGLVVVLPGQPGGPPRDGRPTLPHGGAWIHVGADGRVRAFTGKVEVGQGTTTALAMLVADELRVPLDQVDVIAGDTDVTPWDLGTFGSMGMPIAGAHLRATAAAARAILDDLGTGSYADRVRGLRRIERVAGTPPVTPPSGWTVAGRATADRRAIEAVTGTLPFVTDLARPGMLHAALLHPPRYGATAHAVDLAAARAMPGVTAIHDGDLIAVAAEHRGAAAAALRAIRVEWRNEPVPPEPSLPGYLREHPAEAEGFWAAVHHVAGNVDDALAVAALRLDATYTTAYLAHAPLECRCALAEWADGRATVWVGTQTPFMVREEVAAALGVGVEGVRVVVPPTGGGFGGKHTGEIAAVAARLARESGRPVRLAFGREEELAWASFRPMAVIDVHAGARGDGAPTAWWFTDVNAGSNAILPPYAIAHQRIDYQPAASPLSQGSYRALAATANTFAIESAIDELARLAGADPLAYRLHHLGDQRLASALRAAAERAGARPAGAGRGYACAVEKGGRVATVVDVRVGADRRLAIARIVTAFECGAIVNPDNLRNQIEGALVMGLGGACFEAVHLADGKMSNARLSEYRVPRFSDVPPIEVVLLDRRDQPPAGGGETPMIALAPALANAIHDATGTRLRSLPLAPDGTV